MECRRTLSKRFCVFITGKCRFEIGAIRKLFFELQIDNRRCTNKEIALFL